jgi:hypothetical protein
MVTKTSDDKQCKNVNSGKHKVRRWLSLTLLWLLSGFVFSCGDEPYFQIGTGWVDTNLKVVYIDSCTAKLSTIRIDSTPTYGQSTILVGRYNDVNSFTGETLTGVTTSLSYVELAKPQTGDISNKAEFDSLVIEMRFNGYYMGDTLRNMHLFVHKLAERMKTDAATGSEVYYNTTSFRFEDEPLAEAIFPVRPSNTDAGMTTVGGIAIDPVRIVLPKDLGQDFFEKIRDKTDEFDTNDKFVDYFNGLAFVAGNDVETIVGFRADTSFKVNLHYHILEEFQTDNVITFNINTTNQFNKISSDRTGTLLTSFTENEIDANLTNNHAYISAGDGLYVKIEFPYIRDIMMMSDYGAVEQAILEIKPVIGTYQEVTPLPSELSIYASPLSGEAETQLNDRQNQVQTGNLSIDYQFLDNTNYSFDITSFVQQQLLVPLDQQLYLTLRLPDTNMKSSTQRLVIGNSSHYTDVGNRTYYNRIKLKLYYNMYNNKK